VSNFIHSFKSYGSADLITVYKRITINYPYALFTEEETEAKRTEVSLCSRSVAEADKDSGLCDSCGCRSVLCNATGIFLCCYRLIPKKIMKDINPN